jgi:hypothetical protein
MARFFGYSSAKTICTTVATTSVTAAATATVPAPPISSPTEPPIIGSANSPTSRPVTVMPSCAPESMKLVRRVTESARVAEASPAADSARRRARSTDM